MPVLATVVHQVLLLQLHVPVLAAAVHLLLLHVLLKYLL